jgi:hypothetical protein
MRCTCSWDGGFRVGGDKEKRKGKGGREGVVAERCRKF